jgi:hypothetical protein
LKRKGEKGNVERGFMPAYSYAGVLKTVTTYRMRCVVGLKIKLV